MESVTFIIFGYSLFIQILLIQQMDGPSTDLFSKKQTTTVNSFILSEHLSFLGKGLPVFQLNCWWQGVDWADNVKRLGHKWERLISQALSNSWAKVRSVSDPSPWLHLHPLSLRRHHFFPLIHSHQHSFGFCLPKSSTHLNKHNSDELLYAAVNKWITDKAVHKKAL